MGRMPPALARYWAKHGRGKGKKKASKPKRQKSRGGGRTAKKKKRGGGRRNGGIFFGMGVGHLAQAGYTADKILNGPSGNPIDLAMGGDFGGAGSALGGNAMSNIGDIILGNILIGIGFKLVKRFMPGKMKKYF